MPILPADAFTSSAILTLVAAIGLSGATGLRACLTLFAVGLASDIKVQGHPLLPLHGNFHVLGSIPMLIVLAILAIIEILADKFPGIDTVSNVIFTVVRPIVGAVIVAGTVNSLSDSSVWIAAAVGLLLALGVGLIDLISRLVVTAVTGGLGNFVVSVGQDILTILMIPLLIIAPIVGIIFAAIFALLAWLLLRSFLKRRRRRQSAGATPATQPATVTTGYVLLHPSAYFPGAHPSQPNVIVPTGPLTAHPPTYPPTYPPDAPTQPTR